ncbi:gliding motility-associated lipoprotein GldH [Pontibacter ummariensis]|uniref:Gliding motility-associated lipoprotein GldH n=1 Tax=Pontibacter ummariensis TaxID=1610492 RepID=A0A239B5V6_9BACT|nr:gliding motility lipoprotein GldH [Pontibacter ummariensis]PRY16323.1 gliding motility-associated lipoprotein GldH [Pontibacter ummariensis]SNS03159.1 gliding motility-associated lipoprotein GldH [Pontibacter ummariensis]
MHKFLGMWAAAFLLLLASCDPARVYEQNVDLPEGNWAIDNVPAFEFEIQDTTQVYDVYFNVRYNLQYDYYNLYVRHQLLGPDSILLSSQLHELLLMDSKTGKPLGDGSSDIYDLQVLALNDVTFKKAGQYKLMLTQYMRRDPLPNVLAVGARVAKESGKQ